MIEHNFPYNSFIGGWYIPETICDNIIKFFNDNKKYAVPGKMIKDGKAIVNSDWKVSLDLGVKTTDFLSPFNEYRKYLQMCVENYAQKYNHINEIEKIEIVEDYNIQYYKPNEGFKAYHFERGSSHKSKRVLVFSTFLNDVDDGGTDFFYQNLKVPAKKGLTIIWPTEFTHTHKGIISLTKEKYIVTGWYNFL